MQTYILEDNNTNKYYLFLNEEMNASVPPTIVRTVTKATLYEIIATAMLQAPSYFTEESLLYGLQAAVKWDPEQKRSFSKPAVLRALSIMRGGRLLYWSERYDFLSVNQGLENAIRSDLEERLNSKELKELRTFAKIVWQKVQEYNRCHYIQHNIKN